MANAAGGTIIYGIAEYPKKHERKHYPEKRDQITNRTHEYLDQVINSGIEPRAKAHIKEIPDPDGGSIFVVTIARAETAHQAKDNRYYRRYNFEVLSMRDHEIRDVMNRTKSPRLELHFEIEQKHVKAQPNIYAFGTETKAYTTNVLVVWGRNVGAVYANCRLYIPSSILDEDEYKYREESVDGDLQF